MATSVDQAVCPKCGHQGLLINTDDWRPVYLMATSVDQAVCPKCGHQGLLINTDDWRPVAIRCLSLKCGWRVDLRQFWPSKEAKK